MKNIFRVLYKILSSALAIVLIAIQRILSPLILIRVTLFDATRIGNLYTFYWYDSQDIKNKVIPFKTIDLLFSSKEISNLFWQKLFKKKFIIFSNNQILERVYNLNRRFPGWEKFVMPRIKHSALMNDHSILKNIILKPEPYFSLTAKEISRGKEELQKLGLSKDSEFICFHNRDSAYLSQTQPDKDWSYHDYRDSSIQNYLKAASFLCDQGFYAIRMGAIVREKLTDVNSKIIDYPSTSVRSDFMDIFLGSQCKLFLSSDTGISIIPELFDVPVIYVNFTPFARVSHWAKKGLFIPKHFFSRELNRELTFKEILDNPALSFNVESKYLIDNKIDLIENTEDEILDTVQEMLQRINGTWVDSEEMKTLQTKFWSIAPNIKLKPEGFNVSSVYLLKNKHLFNF